MKSNFEDIVNSEKTVLIDFYGTWCGPCQTLTPILKDVKDELGENIKIVKIDIDKNQNLASQYQVRSVPTMILFNEGIPKWRKSGVLRKRQILRVVEKHS